MKLLFDENLSTRIAEYLQDLFPGCAHVTDLAGTAITDEHLWKVARDGNYVIVLKRNRDLLHSEAAQPKVVYLSFGRAKVPAMVKLLRERHREIRAFIDQSNKTVLTL